MDCSNKDNQVRAIEEKKVLRSKDYLFLKIGHYFKEYYVMVI